MEYCEYHRGEPPQTAGEANVDENQKRTTDICEWDQKFLTVDQEVLFEIILAANYLEIKPLLCVASCNIRDILDFLTSLGSDIGCEVVSNMIEGKTPEEINQLFKIGNIFTPEEEVRGSTYCLECASDILFAAFQALIENGKVSCPRCLTFSNQILIFGFYQECTEDHETPSDNAPL